MTSGPVRERRFCSACASDVPRGFGTGVRCLLLVACVFGGAAVQERSLADDLEVGTRFRDCPMCPELVVVPAGSFLMGSPPNEEGRRDDEGPQHVVTIARPFAVGVYEVTFAEWDACVVAGGCEVVRDDLLYLLPPNQDRDRLPVSSLSWHDAHSYVRWLSTRTGQAYRLPSEAEWEYAARAGTTTPYHTGGTISMAQANYNGSRTYGAARGGSYSRQYSAQVGSFAANGWGLHDVHGNVREWVQDCGHYNSYAGAPVDGSAWEGDCLTRVWRSGGWGDRLHRIRAASRDASYADNSGSPSDKIGLRVVREVASQAEPAVVQNTVPASGTETKFDGAGAMRRPEDGRFADMADAASLVLRVLHRESDDLLPDEDRFAELSSELADVLSRLKVTYPAFARFRVRPRVLGMLAVRFTDEFASLVGDVCQASNVGGHRCKALHTGHEAFDELNEKLGLRHLHLWHAPDISPGEAILHLHERTNLYAAANAYSSAVDGIEWARPAGLQIGGAPDIEAEPTAKGWRIRISNRWGDCPSGCTNSERFLFVAEGETVDRIRFEGSSLYPEHPTL